jgi:hypothetical protein
MRALLAIPLAVAVIASGCATTSSSGDFDGEEKKVADVVEKLQTAGKSGDAKQICDEVLAKALRDEIQAAGSNCEQEVDKALTDADDFDLEVQDVTVTGTEATAQVKGRDRGTDRVLELRFVREGADWRATAL